MAHSEVSARISLLLLIDVNRSLTSVNNLQNLLCTFELLYLAYYLVVL